MTQSLSLRSLLSKPPIVIAPGVYDPLTALIASHAGFQSLYISGASIAYTRLGRPDIGLVSMSEVVETVALISDRVETKLIVDADNGYGNAMNVERTVRLFEKAGAHAIQLEDQSFPKRCGHLDDKSLISADEMVGKIKAAVDARRSPDTLIIARTDAVAVEGFDQAIERATLYRQAGADVLFVERPVHGEANSTVGIFKVVDDGKEATRVQVQLGRTSVNTVEIVKGLEIGDKVILSDMSAWDNYDRVQLK